MVEYGWFLLYHMSDNFIWKHLNIHENDLNSERQKMENRAPCLDNRYLPSSRKVNRPICGKSLKDSRQINPPFTSIRAIAIWSCRTYLGLIWVFSPVFLSIIHNNPLIVISSAHACKCNTALYPAHMIDLCSIITIWNNRLIHLNITE